MFSSICASPLPYQIKEGGSSVCDDLVWGLLFWFFGAGYCFGTSKLGFLSFDFSVWVFLL